MLNCSLWKGTRRYLCRVQADNSEGGGHSKVAELCHIVLKGLTPYVVAYRDLRIVDGDDNEMMLSSYGRCGVIRSAHDSIRQEMISITSFNLRSTPYQSKTSISLYARTSMELTSVNQGRPEAPGLALVLG
jgi:hypothetical protein